MSRGTFLPDQSMKRKIYANLMLLWIINSVNCSQSPLHRKETIIVSVKDISIVNINKWIIIVKFNLQYG